MYERISRSDRIELNIKKMQEDENFSEFTMNLYSNEIACIRKKHEDVEVTVINDCGKLKACKVKRVQ